MFLLNTLLESYFHLDIYSFLFTTPPECLYIPTYFAIISPDILSPYLLYFFRDFMTSELGLSTPRQFIFYLELCRASLCINGCLTSPPP